MKLKRRKNSNVMVPLFSTSDIAFLLLIFIMLLALMNYRREVRVDYPEARTVLNTNAEKNLEIWIDINGSLYIGGDPASLPDIEQAIIELYQTAQDTRVHIIADRNTPYRQINSVLEMLQVLQYRVVSFVVKNAE